MNRKKLLILICFLILSIYKAYQFIAYMNPKKISVATWNAQTFFDVDFSGNEYSEYASSKNGWNEEKYFVRLLRVADALEQINADIIALEEIENLNVVYAITKLLPFNSKLRYAVFAKEEGSSLGLVLFSRYPIIRANTHQIQLPEVLPETLRPVLEVQVNVPTQNVIILVNHWKSKSSGGKKSEITRKCQQALLTESIYQIKSEKENAHIIALGDFNQETAEFEIDKEKREIILISKNNHERVKSIWLEKLNLKDGSYYFRDNWEQIDHIFISSEKAVFGKSEIVKRKFFLTEEGLPKSYKLYSGSGLSDHLPLKAEIILK